MIVQIEDDGRAFLISDEGVELIQSPVTVQEIIERRERRSMYIEINPDGTATAYDKGRAVVIPMTPEQIEGFNQIFSEVWEEDDEDTVLVMRFRRALCC